MRAAERGGGNQILTNPGLRPDPVPQSLFDFWKVIFSPSLKAPLFFFMYEMESMLLSSLGHSEGPVRPYLWFGFLCML